MSTLHVTCPSEAGVAQLYRQYDVYFSATCLTLFFFCLEPANLHGDRFSIVGISFVFAIACPARSCGNDQLPTAIQLRRQFSRLN